MNNMKMLYYDRIYVPKEIYIKKNKCLKSV